MLFSIIVPIYNVENYLRQCVDSALQQTFSDFELILVDDGSPDSCGEIVDSYAVRDKRVVAVHKENGGLVSARKAGVQRARGEYAVILDGDDWLAENALETIANAIKRSDADMICYGHFVTSETFCRKVSLQEVELLCWKPEIEKYILPTLLVGGKEKLLTCTLWGKAFKRELYRKLQGLVDDRIAMGEDGAVVYPCVCEAESIMFLPDSLYYYRINPDSLTQNKKKLIPWEGALLRIEHLKRCMPMDKYDLERQLGCYTAHALFNVILTQLGQRKYADVKKEARDILAREDLITTIQNARLIGSFSEKLAQIAVSNKWIFIIKLYQVLRNFPS